MRRAMCGSILACGITDLRKGFDSLAAQGQSTLQFDPHDTPFAAGAAI
jgi:hypothetical protein